MADEQKNQNLPSEVSSARTEVNVEKDVEEIISKGDMLQTVKELVESGDSHTVELMREALESVGAIPKVVTRSVTGQIRNGIYEVECSMANVRVRVPNLVQAVQRHDIDPDMPIGVLVRAITEGPQRVTFQVLEREKVKRKKAA